MQGCASFEPDPTGGAQPSQGERDEVERLGSGPFRGYELEGTGGDDRMTLTGDFPLRSWNVLTSSE